MRTKITSVTVAACIAAFAQNEPVAAPLPESAPHIQSIYDDCLLTAGASSWKALGLSEDQVVRVSELQNRYKESSKAAEAKAVAEEKAAAKGNGNVKKEVYKAPTAAVGTEKVEAETPQPVEAQQAGEKVEPVAKDNTVLDPPAEAQRMLDKEADFSAATATVPPVEYSPLDTELRAILTPEQLSLWERRCDNRTSYEP